MRTCITISLLLLLFSCKKDESKQIEIIRKTIQHHIWSNENTFRIMNKEIFQKPGGEKYIILNEWAELIHKIREKAFTEKNDSIFYKSRISVIQYAKDLQEFYQKKELFSVFGKVKLDLSRLENADSELDFMVYTLQIIQLEGELIEYIAGMIGTQDFLEDDKYYQFFHSNEQPQLGKPYYFVIQRIDNEGIRFKERYELNNINWKLNSQSIKQPYEIKKLSNAYLILFTPTQKGSYEFLANADFLFKFDGKTFTKINEVKHIINVE